MAYQPLSEDKLKFYTNIRFIHGGNDLHGADCYGIIKLINKREYGVDIGDYERGEASIFACRRINTFYEELIKTTWREVKEPYSGCTVVICARPFHEGKLIADHVGIFVEPNRILSTDMLLKHSQIVPLTNFKVMGYYEFIGTEG